MCFRQELAAIVSREAYDAHPEWRDLGALVVTDDTLRCYGDIARLARERALPVVAVTGSNGKTSLKELISPVSLAAEGFIKHPVIS